MLSKGNAHDAFHDLPILESEPEQGNRESYGVINGIKHQWLTLRRMNGSLAAFCWMVVSEAPPGEGLGEPEPELWSRDLLLVRALRHESMFHFIMDPACREKQGSGRSLCQAWSPGQLSVSAGSPTAKQPSWQRTQPVSGHSFGKSQAEKQPCTDHQEGEGRRKPAALLTQLYSARLQVVVTA